MSREFAFGKLKTSTDDYAEDQTAEMADSDLDLDLDLEVDTFPIRRGWLSCPLTSLLRASWRLPTVALRWLRRLQAWMLLDAAVSVLLLPLHAMQLVARNSQATAMLWVTVETAVELLAAVVMAGVSIFLASVLLLQDAADARRKQAELRSLVESEALQEQVAEPVVTETPTPPPTPRL